jgi:hypothetical protein
MESFFMWSALSKTQKRVVTLRHSPCDNTPTNSCTPLVPDFILGRYYFAENIANILTWVIHLKKTLLLVLQKEQKTYWRKYQKNYISDHIYTMKMTKSFMFRTEKNRKNNMNISWKYCTYEILISALKERKLISSVK